MIKNIFTKNGALILMFFILVLSFIYMNVMNIEPMGELILVLGALVNKFLDGKKLK
jgi:hypothetical protein